MKVRLLKETQDLILYAANYKKIGGSEIPFEYLQDNLVYGFYKNNRLVSGFIIGIQAPFRTISLFAPSETHEKLMLFLKGGKEVCEVCCFWESREAVTTADNIFIWFNMSQKIRVKGKKFFLGGTYVKGLANLYGYPSFAHLISNATVQDKSAWIFIAWRKYSVLSAIEVVIYKFKRSTYKIMGKAMPSYITLEEDALSKVTTELLD